MKKVITVMADTGCEPIGSMGIDTPLAILSDKPQLLFNYFKQSFAQVTNPAIDPIREKNIMSLTQYIGNFGKLIDVVEIDKPFKYIELTTPILGNKELEDFRHLDDADFKAITIPAIFEVDRKNGLEEALENLCKRAEESVVDGFNILIISDRNIDRYNAPIPSLLALGAVHHHLIEKKLRTQVDMIVECGDARDVMHMALLIGFGAKAINPYMIYGTIDHLLEKKSYLKAIITPQEGFTNYCHAIDDGLMKIISKMGISTLQGYCGSQSFQIIGLSQTLIDKYFTGTPSTLSGIDLEFVKRDVLARYEMAYKSGSNSDELPLKRDDYNLSTTIAKLIRQSAYNNDYTLFKTASHLVNDRLDNKTTIRSLLNFKSTKPISIDHVESAKSIIKRFSISGMSFGSISKEAHESIAYAMNQLNGMSNCGEGGENEIRYKSNNSVHNLNSRIKQVASGRFGVTIDYLTHCDQIQIKVAQGAKPGEGGHLPANKVTEEIGLTRMSMSGIDLISPPPHHDIYSIEDLAQLIFDLKKANDTAKVSVKLVSEIGIGTIAAGVAKGHADMICISGHDGGTGASPISSMRYAGIPWELGLAEAQQTLLLNNLRSRVTLQVDGKLITGRDVIIAALLGAEEFGFATTALISQGCTMCRQCHLNKCPAGIATQDKNMRISFTGKPEYLIHYLHFVAEEVREILASLGFTQLTDIVGRVDLLEKETCTKEKHQMIQLNDLLYRPALPRRISGKCTQIQASKPENPLDQAMIKAYQNQKNGSFIPLNPYIINNTDRTIGTRLSSVIAKESSDRKLPYKEDAMVFHLKGSAGQSFGAFLTKGVTLKLEGDANDYVAKGLSGGKITLIPPTGHQMISDQNIIAGNTLLYGATSGEVFINGTVGQRFCVRNSGAIAVVEGIGNHGCEYMTGGIVVILGSVGKNFGAGMSGGIAYILDEHETAANNCNLDHVRILKLNDDDKNDLKTIIEKHFNETKIKKAEHILNKFEFFSHQFLKVCSPTYLSKINN